VGRDGIEPPTPGFSVLAVNPRIVRHFIELCFTAGGASSRHVAVGCSLEQRHPCSQKKCIASAWTGARRLGPTMSATDSASKRA
jgi:hypothetical protein